MSGATPRVPSVGDDPREDLSEVAEAPGKLWFRRLDEAVIEADRCVQCGTCVAACPSDSIGIDTVENRPTLVRMCTGCSSCWDYCPRSGLRYERVVELAQQERGLEQPMIFTAHAAAEDASAAGQDGGVVTALLAALLEMGDIDGAVVATDDASGLATVEDADAPLYGTAALATSREELLACGGSIYNQVMSLGRIHELIEKAGLDDPDLALVGTPCIIEGASALERYDHAAADPIALTVALMCTRTFSHERLVGELIDQDLDVDSVDRLDVSEGILSAYDADGSVLLERDVDAFGAVGLRGCDECADFAGGAADMSAGSIASDDGETTVIVRTERGRRAWEVATPGLEIEPLGETDALEKVERWNRRRARHFLPREYDPDGPVGIGEAEHRAAYDDTDRAPKPFNPARVHQYEEWC